MAVARDPEKIQAPKNDSRRWIGAIAWEAILPSLERLKIRDAALKQQWRDLLRVMKEDGDFRRSRPKTSPELEEAAHWLHGHRDSLLSTFRGAVANGRHNGWGRKPFAEQVVAKPAKAGRRWAYVDFRVPPHSHVALGIRLRSLHAPAPQVWVEWFRPDAPWGMKWDLSDAHERLMRLGFTTHDKWNYFNGLPLLPADLSGSDRDQVLADAIGARLELIARSGVLMADVYESQREEKR